MVDKLTASASSDPWQRTHDALVADIAAHLDLDAGLAQVMAQRQRTHDSLVADLAARLDLDSGLAEITGTVDSGVRSAAPRHGRRSPDPGPDRCGTDVGDDVGTGTVITSLQELETVLRQFGGDPDGANLNAVNMQGAQLSGADLHGADLSRADMRDANLTRANLQGAILRGANLRGADFDGADLEHAELEAAVWDVTTTLPHELANRMRKNSMEVAPGVYQVPPEAAGGPALVTRR